jgi:hypothetical protein
MATQEIARWQALTTGKLNLLQQNAAFFCCDEDPLIGNLNDRAGGSSDFLVSSRSVQLENRNRVPQED